MQGQAVTALVLTCLTWCCGASWAAEISHAGTCDFLIEGVLQNGDGQTFLEALEEAGCNSGLVYLNSPGGEVTEALEIAERIFYFETAIEGESECLSACALIFMAGRTCSGAPYSCYPLRWMSREAKLGFHAPFLQESRSGRLVPLSLSFNSALKTFSTIQELFSSFSAPLKETGYKKDIFPMDLMTVMFTTPPSEFVFISDNDQFFSFDIQIGDRTTVADFPELSRQHILFMCVNAIYSEVRGWNYSKDSLTGYFDLMQDWISVGSANFADLIGGYARKPVAVWGDYAEGEDESFEVDQHYMLLNFINMGPLLSGPCIVSPSRPGGYYDIEFYGVPIDGGSGPSLDALASGQEVLQRYAYEIHARMHYSMGVPLGVPLSDVYSDRLIDPSAVSTAIFELYALGEQRDWSVLRPPAELRIEGMLDKRSGASGKICDVEVNDVVSVAQQKDEADVVLLSTFFRCGPPESSAEPEVYKIRVRMVKRGNEWGVSKFMVLAS